MLYRQVHLDFHTSEHIPDIGKEFDAAQFQDALKRGHIDSITLFSKCHHGWAYHPSDANEIHPHLDFDLLGEQIKAAHAIGVKTPVYLSAGLDEKMARRHPDWLFRKKDGTTIWVDGFDQPGYHKFCMNTPYLPYLLAQIEEVCERYDADGIFLDIVGVQPCYCRFCTDQLRREGKDPQNEPDVLELAEKVYANYTQKVREAIDKHKKGLPAFHNGGHIRRGRRDLAHANTHLELESLPTGGWGYDHFPLSAAYARVLGMDFLGMTGKFHRSWGEFGGYKHPNALRYETALSVSNGAGCSIGDQLHPSGKMDTLTYDMIGTAYRELEQKEPWLIDAVNIADIGIFTTEAANNYYKGRNFSIGQTTKTGASDAGCARMLLEGKYLFNALDAECDFGQYKVIILPDSVELDETLKTRFSSYVTNGGKILATGRSGLRRDGNGFALDFGVTHLGDADCCPDYFRPEFTPKNLGNAAFVMYSQGQKIENNSAQRLADRINPYFNRTAEHFCSHQHTPPNYADTETGMTINNTGVYIAWNVFEDYAKNGSLILKEMVHYALDLLLSDKKSLETNLPSQGIATLTQQGARHIVHLLYASSVSRGEGVEIIEDIVPLYNISVHVRMEHRAQRVYLAPQGQDIPYTQTGTVVHCLVPKLENHQMLVIE